MSLVLLLMVLMARGDAPEMETLQGVAQGTTYHIKFVRPTRDFASKDLQADVEKKLAEKAWPHPAYVPKTIPPGLMLEPIPVPIACGTTP